MITQEYKEAFEAIRKGNASPGQQYMVEQAAKKVGELGNAAQDALNNAGRDRDKQHHSRFW